MGSRSSCFPRREPQIAAPPAYRRGDSADLRRRLHALRRSRTTPELFDFWRLEDSPRGSAVRFAVEQLRGYYEDWSLATRDNFWQRKSHKAVIAVVICRSDDGRLSSHRGMNTEVSLPSGSLCAERTGIARAASDFLAAHQIEAVAVLDPEDKINPLWPCEVCQSWLVKLRDENSAIEVVAVESSSCKSFAVRVNGKIRPPPRALPASPPAGLMDGIELADGVEEWPWQSHELVYIDGAWPRLSAPERHLLRAAHARGTHVLVGIHSDETLAREWGCPLPDDFATRLSRLLDDRHVSSVLVDAPWCLTEEMVTGLGIQRVVAAAEDGAVRCFKTKAAKGAYEVAIQREIFEEVSLEEINCESPGRRSRVICP